MSRTDASRLGLAFVIALTGIAWNFAALALSERWIRHFPSVPDVLLDRLPYMDLYRIGEVFVACVVAIFLATFLRDRANHFGHLLALVGMFYAVRGTFLLLLPLGPPIGAPLVAARFSIYPSAGHAYFPSGHLGLLTLLALMSPARYQTLFWGAAALFAVGACLAKAHYSADLIGAVIVAYAVYEFGERLGRGHLEMMSISSARR